MTTRKVALVTGSGKRRIGSHVAEALAERGYALVIHYCSSAVETAALVDDLRSRGVEAVSFQADLADERSAARLIEQSLACFSRPDVLVNCAAVWERKKLEDVTADDVRRQFEINTLGTFRRWTAAVPCSHPIRCKLQAGAGASFSEQRLACQRQCVAPPP